MTNTEARKRVDELQASLEFVSMCADDALDAHDEHTFFEIARDFHALSNVLDAAKASVR